jgi:4-amino-4-deoxy-L-arabinose transferase-like glycosyltransferase
MLLDRGAWIVLAVALLLRCSLWASGPRSAECHIRPDSPDYIELGRSLATSRTFTKDGAPDDFRTPGFPALLAVCRPSGFHLETFLAVQIGLSCLTVVLTYLWARRLAVPGLALLAGFFVAVDPASICHSLLVLSDSLFTLSVSASLYCLWRAASGGLPWSAAAGFGFGFATLVRPVGVYFPLLAALWLCFARPRRLLPAALVLILASAPAGIWMERNARNGRGFILSEVRDYNLLFFLASPALARATGITWPEADQQLWYQLTGKHGTLTAGWSPERQAQARQLAISVLRANAPAAITVYLHGILLIWFGPGKADLEILSGGASPFLLATSWCILAALLAGIPAGVLALWRLGEHHTLALILCVLAYFTLVSASAGAYARLRIPMVPAAAILSALGWQEALRRLRGKTRVMVPAQ